MKIVKLPGNYKPSAKEPFMNEKQLEYFRRKLLDWRAEIEQENQKTLANLKEIDLNLPDMTDRASVEADADVELKIRERSSKLMGKINKALKRIEAGTYGYCEETGEPIGLERLEARPVVTLSVEAQERHEKLEKTVGKVALKHLGVKDD
jgi:DnaK suppressor protein